MMRRAAQGGLSLPAGEAIEILVVLAGHRELGDRGGADAGRDGTSSRWSKWPRTQQTPPEVLLYMLRNSTWRDPRWSRLCARIPRCSLEELEVVASHAEGEMLRAMLRSERVRNSSRLMELIEGEPSGRAGPAAIGAISGDGAG